MGDGRGTSVLYDSARNLGTMTNPSGRDRAYFIHAFVQFYLSAFE